MAAPLATEEWKRRWDGLTARWPGQFRPRTTGQRQPAVAATAPDAAAGVTDFWWHNPGAPAGPRCWKKLDGKTWRQTDPEGFVKDYRIFSRDDPSLESGWVVRWLANPRVEVWIPELVEGNKTYYRLRDRDDQWHEMAAIHLGSPTPSPLQPLEDRRLEPKGK